MNKKLDTVSSLTILNFQFSAYNDEVLDIQFLGEKESHVAVATNSSEIRVFELSTWNCQLLHGHTDIVLSLHVHSKGKLMVSSSKVRCLQDWQHKNYIIQLAESNF